MSRPRNPTLMSSWKLYVPAPLAARVELLLFDPATGKARHGERARITVELWEEYLSRLNGTAKGDQLLIPLPHLPNAIYLFGEQRFTFEELSRRLAPSASTTEETTRHVNRPLPEHR